MPQTMPKLPTRASAGWRSGYYAARVMATRPDVAPNLPGETNRQFAERMRRPTARTPEPPEPQELPKPKRKSRAKPKAE